MSFDSRRWKLHDCLLFTLLRKLVNLIVSAINMLVEQVDRDEPRSAQSNMLIATTRLGTSNRWTLTTALLLLKPGTSLNTKPESISPNSSQYQTMQLLLSFARY